MTVKPSGDEAVSANVSGGERGDGGCQAPF